MAPITAKSFELCENFVAQSVQNVAKKLHEDAFPLRIIVSRRPISLHILLSSRTKSIVLFERRMQQAEKSLQLNLIRFDTKASLSR